MTIPSISVYHNDHFFHFRAKAVRMIPFWAEMEGMLWYSCLSLNGPRVSDEWCILLEKKRHFPAVRFDVFLKTLIFCNDCNGAIRSRTLYFSEGLQPEIFPKSTSVRCWKPQPFPFRKSRVLEKKTAACPCAHSNPYVRYPLRTTTALATS